MQDLIDRYNTAVSEILRDPAIAAKTGDARVRAYLDLFEPGSDFAEGALANWVRIGEEGNVHRSGPRGEMYSSLVVSVTPVSRREVRFVSCSLVSVRVLDDETGELIGSEGGVQAAEVAAVLVDGDWLLRNLTGVSGDACPPPGEFR